ncbi:LAT2 domain-containing protein isoform X1 [Pleuronectes platessa]|nr:LAT2 domain-containing protein isoform X1 [Pleuronectes platessa]
MLENTSVLAAVLSMVSVVSLSLLSVLCICCKRKTKVIREEDHTYDLQTFQRGGSIFAVMQSRPVTRTNQIPSTTLDIQEEPSQDAADDQSDYENIKHVVTAAHHTGRLEHTYVSPIPNAVYGNDMVQKDENDADQTMGVYENFFQSLPIIDDEDDYENSEFLQQQEDDELDYVNESRVVHPRGTMPRKHH